MKMQNLACQRVGGARWGVVALVAVVLGLVAGCKSEEPYLLELTEEQTRVMGLDFTTLPDAGLVDQKGEPFSFKEVFAGGEKPAIVTEIYTSCPDPDMCPMLMSKTARAQALLAEQGVGSGDYHTIVLSLDPARDTPEAMQKYAEAHQLDFENLHMVTGKKSTLDAVMKSLEVGIRQAPDGSYMHSMRTYVVGKDARITHGFRQSGWAAEHLAERLKSQL